MTTSINMDNVRKDDLRKFGHFLVTSSAGAGVNLSPDPERASLTRDSDGFVVAQYKDRVLARGGFNKATGVPNVTMSPTTPEKFYDNIMKMFENAYETWRENMAVAVSKELKDKVQALLDPPKKGAPQVVLESVSRSDIEELSLRDTLKAVLPENVSISKFNRNEEAIRVSYKYGENGVEVPLFQVSNVNKKTVLTSGDRASPAPVAFFINLLKQAKEYNKGVCGPERIKELSAGLTEDVKDESVYKAFAHHLETSDKNVRVKINDAIDVALFQETKMVRVFIDKKIIAEIKPLTETKPWVRPGYGWSNRAVFAERAFVEGGRKMIAEKLIEPAPEQDWEKELEQEFEDKGPEV